MVWTPNPITESRALLAINLMSRNGWGVEKAAKYAKTTRRTVRRYAKIMGIKLTGRFGVKLKPILKPDDKVVDFLRMMQDGNSATASAKSLKTQVRTMAKRNYKGVPIIVKDGRRWVINFIPVKDHAIVYYGKLLAFNDSVLGRGKLSGPDANKPKNKKKQDEDYADIWWQLDFDDFASTLPIERVAEFWKEEVINRLQRRLESLHITDKILVTKFKTNAKVAADMTSNGRKSNKVSELEKMTGRYDLKLDGDVNAGIDERFDPSKGLDFIPKADFVKGSKATKRTAVGKFQLFFLKKGDLIIYPKKGPLVLTFGYNLVAEQ
jgi:hypothetical protein